MNKINRIQKNQIICLLIAVVHLGITFLTDKGIFVFPDASSSGYGQAVADYIVCKLITLAVLYFMYLGIYRIALDRSEAHYTAMEYFKTAILYIPVVAVILLIKLPQGYISNDENAIYANAVSLTHDVWFNYLTVFYYIVSLMIIPFKYGPIIIKVVIQVCTVGYVVTRIKRYFGSKLGMLGYILFLLYPVIAYTTSAHRLPVYFLLYINVIAKLLFDHLEKKDMTIADGVFLAVAGSMLTQWRTEGIYLFVLVPILCLFVYSNIRNRKSVVVMLACWVVVQYAVSIFQTGVNPFGVSDAANDRMKPFYAYTITNMYRNGLDLEKNKDDLAIVDRYLSLEMIEKINEHYEDINYEDVLILYQDGFVGVRENATVEDFVNYSNALKRIFKNNPDVFIRTRIGAFCYAALPFHIKLEGTSVKGLISFGLSIVKTVLYNLFIPLSVGALLCIYSLIRRRWYSFFVSGGLLAHWFIVFILAPASYFKYYFPVYITAYFYVCVIVLWIIGRRKDKGLISPVV